MAKPMFDLQSTAQGDLLQLIKIEPSATVSKVLLAGDIVRLILFSMDAGQELTEHRSPYTAMIQMLEGDMWVKIDGKEYTLTGPGAWLLMPANAPHSLRAETGSRFVLTMVKG